MHIGTKVRFGPLLATAAIAAVGGVTVLNSGWPAMALSASSHAAAPARTTTTTSIIPLPTPVRGHPQSEGNLSVAVPEIPPQPVIRHLCRDLVSGTRPEPAVWLPYLVAVTGGTQAATTNWCGTLLEPIPPRH